MSLASCQLRAFLDAHRTLSKERRAIWARLAARKLRGNYTHEAGRRAFRSFVGKAAKAYTSAMHLPERWNKAFPAADREQCAVGLERDFRERFRRGELDALLPAKKRPTRRGEPLRRGWDKATIAHNIETGVAAGKTRAKATEAALKEAQRLWAAAYPGEPIPAQLKVKGRRGRR